MAWLKDALRELFGLFVDDVPFTVSILAWLIVVAWVLPRLALDSMWNAGLLFLGCAAILVESVRRTAVCARACRREE